MQESSYFKIDKRKEFTRAERTSGKWKPFLAPYTAADGERFHWMETTFRGYLNNKFGRKKWPSEFTQNSRNKMFLSWQTHEGFQITTFSVIEATKFLLNEGMEFALTERFCQDALEEYFGCQKKTWKEMWQSRYENVFGYNDNSLRIQRSVSIQSGNTRGRKDKCRSWENVSDDPVAKRGKTLHWPCLNHCYMYVIILFS